MIVVHACYYLLTKVVRKEALSWGGILESTLDVEGSEEG